MRGIHAQDKQVKVGRAGERCALNIRGDVGKAAIERGDWLVAAPTPFLTRRFDATLQMLSSIAVSLKHLTPVRLHLGAKRVAAKVYLIDTEQRASRLRPGENGLVQFIVEDDVACCRGDLFLIRDDSESITLGGGKVIDPQAPRVGKARPERLDYLAAMALDSPVDAIVRWVLELGRTLDFNLFRQHWNLRDDDGSEILADPRLAASVHVLETRYRALLLSNGAWQKVNDRLIEEVRRWHVEQPTMHGLAPAALQSRLGTEIDKVLILAALTPLIRQGKLILKDGLLQCAGHVPEVSAAEQSHWQLIATILKRNGSRIPLLSELVTETRLNAQQIDALLRRAVRDGDLCKINDRRFALPSTLLALSGETSQLVEENLPLTVQNYRDRLACGRRLAIELLEYFDTIRFTQRRDEIRVIIDPAMPEKQFSR